MIMVGISNEDQFSGMPIVLKVFDDSGVPVADQNMSVLFAENLIAQLEVAIETVIEMEQDE